MQTFGSPNPEYQRSFLTRNWKAMVGHQQKRGQMVKLRNLLPGDEIKNTILLKKVFLLG